MENKYIDIIVNYFKKLTNNKYKSIYDYRIIKNINILENDHSKLKEILYDIKKIICSSNYYISDYIIDSWGNYFHLCKNKYKHIEKTDYYKLYTFFLLIIHNIPIILSNNDNSIPGCNCLFDDNNIISTKYYEYCLLEDINQLEYTRIYDWAYDSNINSNERCFCKFYF